jgi:hypothetical protein
LQRPFAAWGRPFQNFNLTVVDVLDDLGEIAHIEPLRTQRALVIGLAPNDAAAIGTGVAGKFGAHVHHRSSRMPLKNGCRTLPSADLARYSISASNDGSTQMPRCVIFLA